MIEFDNLKIGHHQSLASVAIQQLNTGQIYALIGSNGSGKSTFLKTICGQQRPFSGSVSIDGKNTMELSRSELAKLVAFVPSRFPEAEFVRVVDFISLGRTPYLNSLGNLSEADKKCVDQTIRQLNIVHLSDKFISQLSDGERQLCSVARALAQQTPIILLDEPTGYLDYRNKRRLLELLSLISTEMNRLIVFSSHDIETLLQFGIQLLGIEAETASEKNEPHLVLIDKNIPFETMIHHFYR